MATHTLKEPVEIDYEALPEDASIFAHLSAGAFAGIMEHTVMFPVDSIKTRMQMLASGQPLSRSVIASISRISSSEGAYALWRGVSSVVLGAGPAHAVYFSVFEATKTTLVNRLTNTRNSKIVTDESHPLIASGAGIMATVASDALMTPFDVLKQRMQLGDCSAVETAAAARAAQNAPKSAPAAQNAAAAARAAQNAPKSAPAAGAEAVKLASRAPQSAAESAKTSSSSALVSTARTIYSKEGLRAFYISYPTTLFTNIPFAALNFGFYEYSSSVLNPDNIYNPYYHCVSGGIAGGVAAALTNPLDCIKTALQTRGVSTHASLRNINGFASAAKALYRHGGLSAFARGLKPRIIFNVPSTAISWTAYEMAKEVLLRD